MSSIWSAVSWSLLILVLFVATFGFQTFLFVATCFFILIAACFLVLKFNEAESTSKGLNKYLLFFSPGSNLKICPTAQSIWFASECQSFSPVRHLIKKDGSRGDSFTGESGIDEEIDSVLNYILRDYVLSWYRNVSPNEGFLEELRSMTMTVIRNIAQRAQSIDRVHYITTKLVDDFASHLRLYRLAEHRLRLQKLEDPNANLLSIFFDLELQMEQYSLCRDVVSEDEETCNEYLTHISDILQYLLLPPDCFANGPLRYFLQTVLVNSVLSPLVDLLSDPDFINQTLIWFCKANSSDSSHYDIFLIVLRCCDNADELSAVLEMVNHEIDVQRSRDTGEEDDFNIKQQINSLLYVQKVIRNRLKCLTSGDSFDSDHQESVADLKRLAASGNKLFQIPFDVILKNNVALSYFIEYMSSINAQGYVYFYLNVEGFRISAEQQLSEQALRGPSGGNPSFNLNNLREAANNIFETYLALERTGSHKLILDDSIVKSISEKIKSGKLSETWFDEAHQHVFDVMRDEDLFFPSFKKSSHYVKLLAELDLLKDVTSNNNSCSVSRKSLDDNDNGSIKSGGSYDSESIHSLDQCDEAFVSSGGAEGDNFSQLYEDQEIFVEISHTGVVREFGNSYGVYCISVQKKEADNLQEEKWCVLRRYSDFYTFHHNLQEKFPQLRNLALPGKRPFNNITQEFLEQRRHLLNSYLLQVIRRLAPHYKINGLKEYVLEFLEPGTYGKEKTSVVFAKTVNTLVNPFKSSVKTVGNIVKVGSDNIKDSIHKLSKLGSLASSSSTASSSANSSIKANSSQTHHLTVPQDLTPAPADFTGLKFGKSFDADADDNIPLRIMLLLMDEVFDLKNKNLWLRRRIIAVIRQIIQATFGDKINRKIVDYVEEMTSAPAIAEYVRTFRDAFWPSGVKAPPRPERNFNTKMRTRVAAKMFLLSHLSDELKHIIGSETTRKGLLCVFQMFQNQQLNKRLILVLLEGFLQKLFPDNYFPEVFERLHSVSPRVKNKSPKKSGQKWPPFLCKFNGRDVITSKTASPASSTRSSPIPTRH